MCIIHAQTWSHYTNNDDVTAIISDDANIYFGTSSGLVIMDRTTEEITLYNSLNSDIPSNWIVDLAIFENKLWIGTNNGGLTVFDGNNWQVVDRDNSDLSSNNIYSLTVNNNVLWIGNLYGLDSYDGTNWQNYPDVSGYVNDMVFDGDSIWAATNRGLNFYNGSGWTVFDNNNSDIPARYIKSLVMYHNKLHIGTMNFGLAIYNGYEFTVMDTSNSDLPSNWINDLYVFDDKLWVATSDSGIASINGKEVSTYNHENSGLPYNNVNTIYYDNEDLWAGTLYGLASREDSLWVYHDISSSGLPQFIVTALAVQGDKVWVGTFNGLASFDGENWVVYRTDNSDLPDNHVTSLAVEGNMVIVGTSGGGLASFDGHNWITYIRYNPGLPNITTILPNGPDLWVGTSAAGLLHLDSQGLTIYDMSNSGLPNNWVLSLAIDEDTLWVGTNDGFASFDGSIWQSFDINRFFEMPHQGRIITSILPDQGKLWLCTMSAGLALFDGQVVTNIYLANQYVNTILRKDNVIWAASYGGVSCFDGSEWATYDPTNSGLTTYRTRCMAMSDDYLWIGTFDGLVRYDMKNSSIESTAIPEEFLLSQNYPNPFNPVTSIDYQIPEDAYVELSIFDMMGKKIVTLVNEQQSAGTHHVNWDANNNKGRNLPSGLYVYRIVAGDHIASNKMLLLK